jgi:orotate phosphoribosyltransferase
MADLGKLLEESGAILKGHFLLASGRHSAVYFEKFRILERPDVLSLLCKEIADHYREHEFDAVAGPTTGGIIIAFDVARQLGLPAIYVETDSGRRSLRRGKVLEPGTRVLIVDDVLTTGGSIFDTREAIKAAGGEPVAFGVLIDRTEPGFDPVLPMYAAYRVDAESFAPDNVPDWLAEQELIRPGASKAKSIS